MFFCNSLVVALRLAAVHIVPPVARELLLIEQRAVRAQERRTLVALAPVVAHMVRLAARLHVRVHARRGRHIAAVEIRVRHLVQNRIVNARRAGNLAKVLALGLALLLRCVSGRVVDGRVLVVLLVLLMLRLMRAQLLQVLLVVLRIVRRVVLL